jgi:hypothetical protein
MKKRSLPVLLFLFTCQVLHAQDTLPNFTVKNAGNNRIVVSWSNNFNTIRQISIQRSFDSLQNFKTILTVPDPTPPQNGYVDTKATNDHMFYRIYVMLEKGIFMFSPSKRPAFDSSLQYADLKSNIDKGNVIDKIPGPDSVFSPGIGNNNRHVNAFKPSPHVYTHKDGFVRINLPEGEERKFHIKFFEDNGAFLFELKDIKIRSFKIDKSDFYHAGWFRFELYEDGKLIENYKFFLEKDF